MLKIVIVSILMLSSIFWGLFPASENSPHNLIANYLGYTNEIHYSIYILIGVIFYLLAAFLSQQNSVQYMWK
jgi:hypothetical protein